MFLFNDPAIVFDPEPHTYSVNGVGLQNVTGVMQFTDPRYYTLESRMRGSYIHECATLHHLGQLDRAAIVPEWEGFFVAYERFLEQSRIEIQHMECRVADTALGYAGTADILTSEIGLLQPPPHAELSPFALIDIKTGEIPSTVGAQTAAYTRVIRGALNLPWVHRGVLNLRESGIYKFHWLDSFDDEDDFLAMLRVAHFRRRHGYA